VTAIHPTFSARLLFEFATTVKFDGTAIEVARDGFHRLRVAVTELGQLVGTFVTSVDECPAFGLTVVDAWLADRLRFVWGLVSRAMVAAADWSNAAPVLGPEPLPSAVDTERQADSIVGEAVVTWAHGGVERVSIVCLCAGHGTLVVDGVEIGYFTRHMGLRWYSSVVQSIHIEPRSGLVQRAQLWRIQNPRRAWDTDSCS